jgi:hypothetical protein
MRLQRFRVAFNKKITMLALFLSAAFLGSPARSAPVDGMNIGVIETTLVDSGATFYGTFQSHNQKVVATPDGIFVTYSRNREPVDPAKPELEVARWRLARSKDGGKTFQTILEATHGTRAPALESDEAGNLYMTHPDWSDPRRPFYFYRFARGGDYARPKIATIPDVACGAKYAMVYDPGRKQFYIAAQYGQLLTISPEGKLLRRGTGFGNRGPHAGTQYPHLMVSPDGVLHHAMTTVGRNEQGKAIYWDIHYMNSPDGGKTWRKLDGTPLPDQPVPDDTGPTDRISLDDECEVSCWLANMLVHDGKVHFIYRGETMHYVRYDLTTGRKDVALDGKQFSGPAIALSHVSGLLASRPDQPGSPLYCVARDPARRTLACLVSRDNGSTWLDGAVADREFATMYAVGGARQLTNDGHVVGSFTGRSGRDEPRGVWFYCVKAVNTEQQKKQKR